VKLFAADVRAAPDEKRWQRALAYRLLNHAVSKMWDIPRLEVLKTTAGAPYFANEPERHLSISHTSSHVLVGVSESKIGIDIEALRELRPGLDARLFKPSEIEEIGFFGGWTARESIFKLTGAGSLFSLRLFPEGDFVKSEAPGAVCRVYKNIPGCVAAAACYDRDFAPEIEIVPIDAIYP